MSSQTVSVVDTFKSQLHNLQTHTSYTLASLLSGTRTYTYARGVRSVMQIHISSGRSNNIVAVLYVYAEAMKQLIINTKRGKFSRM